MARRSGLKRGALVTVAAGSGFGGKPRPALVLQADALGDLPTMIVALLTTALGNEPLIRPRFEPTAGNGLRAPSNLMTDILVTIRRDRIGEVLGHLAPPDLARAERALLTTLGFGG